MAINPSPQNRRRLTAAVGAGCCAVLLAYVPQFEGVILRGYSDPIGIVTACAGHTATAILGKPYSKEECETLLVDDLVDHAEGVDGCTKDLTTGQRAAAISFAFNVGVAKFCGSTFARRLNAHDAGACMELDRWTRAGGEIMTGLVKRRAAERAICEGRMA